MIHGDQGMVPTDQEIHPGQRLQTRTQLARWVGNLACLVSLAMFVFLSLPARATASCPPYRPDRSLLDELAELGRRRPGAAPLTPEQQAQLKELAQLKTPEQLETWAQLEVGAKGLRTPLLVYPPNGPAPLTVDIRWWDYPVQDPVRVEFDVDGDGVPEWSQSGFEPASGPRTHTYQQEGQYHFTVRVHDRSGQVTTYTIPISVLSLSAFDADLQARWATLKAALRKVDIPAALECIHTQSRSRYREAFKALSASLPQKTDQIFTTIHFVEHDRSEAFYKMVRTDAGIDKSFEVRFEVDVDGVWRLTMF